MRVRPRVSTMHHMREYVLVHHHAPTECATAFAAWRGFDSPLRGRTVPSTCLTGGHQLWWRVSAGSSGEALELLPRYLAERTSAIEVRDVAIP